MLGQSLAQRHCDVGRPRMERAVRPRAFSTRPLKGCFHAEEAGGRLDLLSISISAPPLAGSEDAQRSPAYNSGLSLPARLQAHDGHGPQRLLGCPRTANEARGVSAQLSRSDLSGVAGLI